jgi:hypothetical protein
MLYHHIYLVGYGPYYINYFAACEYELVSLFMVD